MKNYPNCYIKDMLLCAKRQPVAHCPLLESRIDRNKIRQVLIKKLSLSKNADLSTHKALLALSKTKEGKHRLVTTNIDLGFKIADSNIIPRIGGYPNLPPVTPHMNSIVHLHGIIDKELDPEGENLVFTSGDFGKAYLLHDPRASRFVTDLFCHFTVLFVGYSLNDPIVRYLTDAIAAERQTYPESFIDYPFQK